MSVCFLLCALAASGLAAADEQSLEGLWSYRTTFGSPIAGELILARNDADASWLAMVGEASTLFVSEGREFQFGFPGDSAGFRGRFEGDGKPIHGYWTRPGITSDPRYPGGSSQPFVTPLMLNAVRPWNWRASVRPLGDPFTLYLKVFRDADGNLLAAFRNHDQNSRGGASQFRVVVEGDAVRFSAQLDPSLPETRLDAKRRANPDRLEIFWPDLDRTIDLERRTPEQAADFFPRPPGSPPYSYAEPIALSDEWPTARASAVGIDEATLARLVQSIIDGDPAARRPSLIHSVLVARQGKLVLEEYFHGYDRETSHDTRSAAKTFASVLLGAVMRQYKDVGPDTKVYDLLAKRRPFANPDRRKTKITLAHLMTHNSGLACNDNDNNSPGNENRMQTQREQPNWWQYTLDLPMAHEPGTRYAYCSANINLMGAALTEVTGSWLPALFDSRVATPLAMANWHWNLMPTTEGYLGGGVFMRPRDLLKVGQMYLDGGMWHGRRIVDAAWVAESTASHAVVSPATTGYSPEEFGDYYGEGEDGYAWHLGGLRVGDRVTRTYAATGNGGQQLIVVPEYQLVVAFTGANYMQGGIWSRWGEQFIGGYVIPGVGAAASDEMKSFATRYASAWNSRDPMQVAAFYAERGSLKINDGVPSVGRTALAEAAQSFMDAFPDMHVAMDAIEPHGDRWHFRWTLTGTNTGPDGSGRKLRISGYEDWKIGPDGLVAESFGHFDAADFNRQIKGL